MNKKRIFLAGLLVAVLLLSMVLVASARTNRTNFSAYEYDCLTEPPAKDWMEGGIWHVRGIVHKNFDFSTTPEMNGINTTVADAEFNLKTGVAVFRGKLSIQPHGIVGTWEGSWIVTVNKGVGVGKAVAQGTGALAGKTLFLKLYDDPSYDPAVDDPIAAALCASVGGFPEVGKIYIEGYILEPGR